GCCNALMFGSETCGDFTDYVFDTITITGAGKSGLGMVSMDGAKISDVHYRNITMSGVASPIMQKIGDRKRCGNSPGVGSISNGDSRAAVIANNASALKFTNFTFDKSKGPNDFVFQNVSGYCVTSSSTPRISASGSTKSC